MKRWVSILLTSAIIAFSKTAIAVPGVDPLSVAKQDNEEQITQEIQVAFPDFAVVSLKSGDTVTGNFIDLNELSLIISFRDYVAGIPLAEIESIEFKDKVLIPMNENVICLQTNNSCRRVPLAKNQDQEPTILKDIPFANLSLFRGSKTALLTIPEQSKEEEEDNTNEFSDKDIHIINTLEIEESGEVINLTLTSAER